MVSFEQAVHTCIVDKYAVFRGRAPCSEYWWFHLFQLLVSILVGFIAGRIDIVFFSEWGVEMMQETGERPPGPICIISSLVMVLVLLMPNLAVTVRRLHDIGLSGWWYGLFWFVCVMSVVPSIVRDDDTLFRRFTVYLLIVMALALFVAMLRRGTRGHNRFGADPLEGHRTFDA